MGKSKGASAGGLKLNYKRTFLIGFAFFGILLLWQVYDSWCPTFLTDIFARRMFNLSSAELKAGDPATTSPRSSCCPSSATSPTKLTPPSASVCPTF